VPWPERSRVPAIFSELAEMNVLLADLETRSRVDLKKAGHRRYAADSSTAITTASWVWKGRPNSLTGAVFLPGLTGLGAAVPLDFLVALMSADRIVFHNAGFDASVIRQVLKYNIPLRKLSCTMARAQRMSLPGGLDELAKTLGVPGKSQGGNLLVMKTCKPQRDGTFCEDPETFRDLLAYNLQDVRSLVAVDERLPELPPEERRIWERTWRKNEIGLPLDLELAYAVASRRQEIELEVANELRELTNGVVTAVTQRQRIGNWLRSLGVVSTDLRKETIEELLEDEELPPAAREVLEIVVESGGMAPTKATALLERHDAGFYKDHTRYFGARSGRGTSEGVNTFNIARPSGSYDIEAVIRCLKVGAKTGDIKLGKKGPDGERPRVAAPVGNVALTDVLRGMVCAPVGYEVIDADLSNIELRLALWFAGDAERLAILGADGDLYMHNAINALGLPKDATKKTHPDERQNFKTVTLGCLGPDTRVLTSSGPKPIVEVTTDDLLWDGVEWVRHEGLIAQGVKDVIRILDDLWLTPDHLVLCGSSWTRAELVTKSAHTRLQALTTGLESLRSRGTLWDHEAESVKSWSHATVALQSTEWTSGTSRPDVALVALLARLRNAWRAFVAKASQTLFRMTICEHDCSTGFQQPLAGATTRETRTSKTTELVELQCVTNGETTREPFYATLSLFRGMITSCSRWTGRIMTAVMSRVTYASSLRKQTPLIDEKSKSCSARSMTYDIACAGPRKRFTVLTRQGPIIVHNCNYGLGWKKFFASQRRKIPKLTPEVAQAWVSGYRRDNPKFAAKNGLWNNLDTAAREALWRPGFIIEAAGGKIAFCFSADNPWQAAADDVLHIGRQAVLWLRLPSGRAIPHYAPTIDRATGDFHFLRARHGRMLPQKAYGGAWTEIACFGPETAVVTNKGLKRIVDVVADDLLWDGTEWVSHGGVACRGAKETTCLDGVCVTSDHKILCLQPSPNAQAMSIWRTAGELKNNPALLRQAFSLAEEKLPWRRRQLEGSRTHYFARQSETVLGVLRLRALFRFDGILELAKKGGVRMLSGGLTAIAGKKTFLSGINRCLGVESSLRALGAMDHINRQCKRPSVTTHLFARTTHFVADCCGFLLASCTDATIRTTQAITTTAAEVSMSGRNGASSPVEQGKENSGERLGRWNRSDGQRPRKASSWPTLSLCQDMPIRHENLIESTMKKATSPEISGLSPRPRTSKTDETSKTSNSFGPTFDIVDCGPRRRFAICSPNGNFLIVHNCQSTARDVITRVEAQIEAELPDVTIIMDIYDSSVSVAHASIAKQRQEQILAIMRRPIPWLPGLPLNAEGHSQQRMAK
jgi:hypothetical protein